MRRWAAMLLLGNALASLTALSTALSTASSAFYTVSGAGNATANGVYHATASVDTFLAAATGLTLFRYEVRDFLARFTPILAALKAGWAHP